MLKSTFIMFLEVTARLFLPKNNMPLPYNLHNLGFAGNFVGFFGNKT